MILRLLFVFLFIFSSYLAGQIGELKPEIGEVNHKILHGLLGGVSGGITASLLNKSFEDGAVSGALGGLVSEVMAEMLSPEIPRDLSDTEFKEEFIARAERSAKWGEFTGTLSAFLAGHDAEIAQQVASNAVENNFLAPYLLYQAAGIMCEADAILKTYERDGLEAALKHLGIAAVTGVAFGATVKIANNTYKTFKSLKKAYDFALSKSPILRKALGKLEKKIESIEIKSDIKLNKEQPWTIREGQSWKEKVMGKAQNTKTEGHAFRSYREAINAAKRDDVEKVFLNRGIRKATDHPIEKPNTRPDVTIRRKDGKIEQIEVPSKSDKPEILNARMEATESRLPEYMRSGEFDLRSITKELTK